MGFMNCMQGFRWEPVNIADLEMLLAAEGFDPRVYGLGGRLPEYEGLILRKTDAAWTIEHFERGVCRPLEALTSEGEACRRMHELLSRRFPPDAVKHERSRPKSAGPAAPDQFRRVAAAILRPLEEAGFHRAPQLETDSPTVADVVFLGRHVGFVFSYDIRDEVVDAEVVRVASGRIRRRPEGGYSSDLYLHLVEHGGYRGSPRASSSASPGVGTTLEGWLALLRSAGAGLLADRADSLPP